MGDMDGGADVVSVAQMGEEGEDSALRLPRSMLTRIIQARLEEIYWEKYRPACAPRASMWRPAAAPS